MKFEKVIKGILRYLDSEVYSGMNDWQEFLARMAVARTLRNTDGLKSFLINNAFVKTFQIVDEEGNVDVEGITQDLREQVERKGNITFTIPMFGKFSFSTSDVDKLHRMIMEAV